MATWRKVWNLMHLWCQQQKLDENYSALHQKCFVLGLFISYLLSKYWLTHLFTFWYISNLEIKSHMSHLLGNKLCIWWTYTKCKPWVHGLALWISFAKVKFRWRSSHCTVLNPPHFYNSFPMCHPLPLFRLDCMEVRTRTYAQEHPSFPLSLYPICMTFFIRNTCGHMYLFNHFFFFFARAAKVASCDPQVFSPHVT